jgi:hypothetical protein
MRILFASLAILAFVGCGQEADRVVEKPVYPPGCDESGCEPGPGPSPGAKISYQEMQGHLNVYCAGCHANDDFMDSERALRSSSAFDRIFNNSMPPRNAPKDLPQTIRTKMVNFFR